MSVEMEQSQTSNQRETQIQLCKEKFSCATSVPRIDQLSIFVQSNKVCASKAPDFI